MKLPLEGVRILAVEQYGAGPFGSLHLADMGAEVIKIENPADGGDVGRGVGPYFFGPGDSHFYQAFNRNKKSLALNLKAPEGMAVFHRLAQTADAVFDNLRGDLPAKLGLTYDTLKHVNPKIVCAHLSAYGREGSRKNWPGYDYLMQAEAGYLSVTGEPDGPPARMGLSVIDMMTGVTTALAMLAGIIDARANGKGRDMDVSLYDVAMSNLNYVGTWYLNESQRVQRQPRSAHPSLTPSQLYRTQDGWIFVMCNKEKFWPVLANGLGIPELATDARFCNYKVRLSNREALTEILDAKFGEQTTAVWLKRLAGLVPVSPVYDVAQALDNPFAAERACIMQAPHPTRGTIRTMASPIRSPQSVERVGIAPELGADTDSLLQELGYDAAAIARLRDQGTV